MSKAFYSNSWGFQWPMMIFLGLCLLVTLAILFLNSGSFFYTLDDPYIHLRVAENIVQGHYGINLSEYAAPSSSVLWPFLLVPFSAFHSGEYVPLILNVFFSLGTIGLFTFIAKRVTSDNLVVGIVVVSLMLGTNLVGLTFTGMEHSFQVFLAMVIAAGLIIDIEKGMPPWWLILAAILGPLVRYEFLILTVMTSFYLTSRKHFLLAGWCIGLPLVFLLGFSWFLVSLGLEPLPSSVIVKAQMFTPEDSFPAGSFIQTILNLLTRQGTVLALSLLLLGPVFLNTQRSSSERALSLCVAMVAVGHLATAPMHFESGFLHFDRYDMYVFAFIFGTLLYFYRTQIAGIVHTHNRVWLICISLGLMVVITLPYLKNLLYTPLASNNIYEQQYQMQRFAQHHYEQAVAVNDLGLVSYRNPHYVLDLWGLGSIETMRERHKSQSVNWMDRVVKKHNVHAAMIYDSWFPKVPKNWIRMATLRLSKLKISPSNAAVTFYALDEKSLPSLSAALHSFQADLPPPLRLELEMSRDDPEGSRPRLMNNQVKSDQT